MMTSSKLTRHAPSAVLRGKCILYYVHIYIYNILYSHPWKMRKEGGQNKIFVGGYTQYDSFFALKIDHGQGKNLSSGGGGGGGGAFCETVNLRGGQGSI